MEGAMAWVLRNYAVAGLLVLALSTGARAAPLAGPDIRKAIIQQSLVGYPGPCTCPYNTMRNGKACGGRSAYSRPAGYTPVCYDSDVTPAMINSYRASHK
jgi:hypothetical protein